LCEDTRVSSKLLQRFNINKKLINYNDHNAQELVPEIVRQMADENLVFALISDAGTPIVSDPGYKLVQECIRRNIGYTFVPGACAVISALVLSGLAPHRFLFDGFADYKKFSYLSQIDSTIILFESPRRLHRTMRVISEYFGNREIAVVREMTKIYEEVIRGNAETLATHFEKTQVKGEIVIVIAPMNKCEPQMDFRGLAADLADSISPSRLSSIIAKHLGVTKNTVYDFLMERKNKEEEKK
jgi:16S rRNA (cytidine1402-2'-O)-methyltransferase